MILYLSAFSMPSEESWNVCAAKNIYVQIAPLLGQAHMFAGAQTVRAALKYNSNWFPVCGNKHAAAQSRGESGDVMNLVSVNLTYIDAAYETAQ